MGVAVASTGASGEPMPQSVGVYSGVLGFVRSSRAQTIKKKTPNPTKRKKRRGKNFF